MASLTDIRQALAAGIADNTTHTTYANLPSSVTTPCVYPLPLGQARNTMGRGYVTYRIGLVCVAAVADLHNGQETLDAMLATDTPESVLAVFDLGTDPFGLTETDFDASGWDDYGVTELAGKDYLTATISVNVVTKGS